MDDIEEKFYDAERKYITKNFKIIDLIFNRLLGAFGVLFILGAILVRRNEIYTLLGFITIYAWLMECVFLSYWLKYKPVKKRIKKFRSMRDDSN